MKHHKRRRPTRFPTNFFYNIKYLAWTHTIIITSTTSSCVKIVYDSGCTLLLSNIIIITDKIDEFCFRPSLLLHRTRFTFLIKELFTTGRTFCESTLYNIVRSKNFGLGFFFFFFEALILLVHFHLKTISQFHSLLKAIVEIPLIYFIIILGRFSSIFELF